MMNVLTQFLLVILTPVMRATTVWIMKSPVSMLVMPVILLPVTFETNIQQPRVMVGGDSGQGKFIFTLTVLNMSDLGRDSGGYSRSSKKRTIVIAACDESHENINQIVSLLKLDELEILHWILAGDLKFANLCFGRFSNVL